VPGGLSVACSTAKAVERDSSPFFVKKNGFITISCITVEGFMNFRGDLEVVLVKKRGVKTTNYY
jgi:hypothetical protein